jgi:hypothetical protein
MWLFIGASLVLSLPLSAELNPIWLALHDQESLDPNEDSDGDGATNQMESLAGTHPLVPTDHFAVSSVRIQKHGILVRWNSVKSRRYLIEHQATPEEAWNPILTEIDGLDGQQEAVLSNLDSGQGELRLKIGALSPAEEAAVLEMNTQDTDADGQLDIVEYLAGTHPFDPSSTFGISEVLAGPLINLEWSARAGKAYQVQCSPDLSEDGWVDAGAARNGVEGEMNASFALSEVPGRFFRILVNDRPSEVAGLTEWEAIRLGLDPIQRGEYQRSGLDNASLLSLPNVIDIETPEPVANATRGGSGMVEVRRTQGVERLVLPFTVSGTATPGIDYQVLPSEIVLPFGSKITLLPIIPLPGYQGTAPKSIILTFQIPTEGGPLPKVVTINLIRESAISVMDHGAVGDGVSDDTAAIQAAIVALENSTTHNTLWFPTGTYRLSQLTVQAFTTGSNYRTLFLGSKDLSGRDLIFAGASGAVLLSKTGTTRSHILLTRARWRSLAFHDLTFEKDSQPLNLLGSGSEPNGAYAVAVVAWYGQALEKLGFKDCSFINCHGAARTFSTGSSIWGNLKQFGMFDCEVRNPYGSNTIQGATAYGGGQQVYLSPWVGSATYRNNLFVGGPDEVTNLTLNPGGVPKDGSHFGSPGRLTFEKNVVQNMGVEAVFPTSDPLVARVAASFQIPTTNSGLTVSVSITNKTPEIISSFFIGDQINVRAWVNGANRNCLLTVRDVNAAGTVLTLENLGQSSEPIDGFLIPVQAAIYSQNKPPCEASITNNIITTYRGGMGIASNSKAYIAGNFIGNHGIGINFYPEVRDLLGKPERGSLAENNIIVWNPSETAQWFSYGIQSWGSEITLNRNFVQANLGVKCFGIVTRGDSDRISANFVSIKVPRDNGYSSTVRAVGIGIGNTAIRSLSSNNSSRGFDVGMGPAQPYQNIPYQLDGHFSFDDVFAIDPLGTTP